MMACMDSALALWVRLPRYKDEPKYTATSCTTGRVDSALRAGDFNGAQQVFPTVRPRQPDGQLTAGEDDGLVQSFQT